MATLAYFPILLIAVIAAIRTFSSLSSKHLNKHGIVSLAARPISPNVKIAFLLNRGFLSPNAATRNGIAPLSLFITSVIVLALTTYRSSLPKR